MNSFARCLQPLVAVVLIALGAACGGPAPLSDDDLGDLDLMTRWPPEGLGQLNPTNALLALPADKLLRASKLGDQLFHEKALSRPGCGISCADCHPPPAYTVDTAFAKGCDGAITLRHPPSLLNVRHQQWFTWDGGADTLWAQAIRPLKSPVEMNTNADHVSQVLADGYGAEFEAVTGVSPSAEPDKEAVLAALGKVLEVYERSEVFTRRARSPFDNGVHELLEAAKRGEEKTHPLYPGVSVFMVRGKCALCHKGPHLSGGFRNAAVADETLDPGRLAGIDAVLNDAFNSKGRFSDNQSAFKELDTLAKLTGPRREELRGAFRIATLRNVALTAPYMHNGSLATLEDVVDHYDQGGAAAGTFPGVASESIGPLHLTSDEKKALVELLKLMTSPEDPQ